MQHGVWAAWRGEGKTAEKVLAVVYVGDISIHFVFIYYFSIKFTKRRPPPLQKENED